MKSYVFIERKDDGEHVVAELDEQGNFSGPQADMIEKILRDDGWPDKAPDIILWGIRLWAAEKPTIQNEVNHE